MSSIQYISVIVATKGRPQDVERLIRTLGRQTRRPERVLVVGTASADLPSDLAGGATEAWVARAPGLTIQRNEAVRRLDAEGLLGPGGLVVFFDDDFRPAGDWLELCAAAFDNDRTIVGMTGCVLADGVHGTHLDEAAAAAYISGARTPEPHWATGTRRETKSVYGCNMAFRAAVMTACRFDEALPLYGWQEDRDMTGQASLLGRVVFLPECRGVHLGSSGGRTSGVRLGYSQIANLVHCYRKGTVEAGIAARFIAKALVANTVRSVYARRDIDYGGRLSGNLRAIVDLMLNRCEPRRILNL